MTTPTQDRDITATLSAPREPDKTAPDHWGTIRAALAPGATDDARAAALVAVDALSPQEDR